MSNMSDVWRIFVVEEDEHLNQNIVSSLRKDGYEVQGVTNGTDAVRVLWAEEYNVVISDLRIPGADGFELLEWLRAYRPNTRVLLIGTADADLRMQALESGADSYIERPVDPYLLKEELRRLLQQTGFSANLDSFDLLDVIQMVNMSRKNITLLVNTGLEEHGTLRFKDGELVWAEYGLLRGDEAFFALAAHKNGTVIHQPWSGQITSNVVQPLSRLIFQALQYRSKYAQMTGEQEAVASSSSILDQEIDDSPFVFVEETAVPQNTTAASEPLPPSEKEWWEQTGRIPGVSKPASTKSQELSPSLAAMLSDRDMTLTGNTLRNMVVPTSAHKTGSTPPSDLPSWLTEQPTASGPRVRRQDATPITESPAVWSPPTTEQLEQTAQRIEQPMASSPVPSRAEWSDQLLPSPSPVQPVSHNFSPPARPGRIPTETRPLQQVREQQPSATRSPSGPLRAGKRSYNYPALISALQTLGYAVPGFIAAAIVSLEGQPIAQVTVDDLDISAVCKRLSLVLKSTVQSLDQHEWGECEDLVVSSSQRHTLLRLIRGERDMFLILITGREAETGAYLEMMGRVEGTISTALHG